MSKRQGGYRRPSPGQPPAGPGRFSTRQDGNQPVRTPDLDDPGMNYGDRQMLEQGQRMAPIPQGGTPRPGASKQPPRVAAIPEEGQLPSFLAELPTNRPNEPVTEGLSIGPGAGPEVLPEVVDYREAIMDYLVRRYSNQDAANELARMRGQQPPSQGPMPLQQPMGPPPPDEFEEDILPGDSPIPLMGDLGDELPDEELAQEPSEPAGEEISLEPEGGEEAPPPEGEPVG